MFNNCKIILYLTLLGMISAIFVELNTFNHLNIAEPKWQWIRNKIYHEEEQAIDYAIIGGSRALCDMKSNQMSNRLGGAKVWNLSRNWFSRAVDYYTLKHLIKHHKLNNVILNFMVIENLAPHPMREYLMLPSDIPDEIKYLQQSLGAEKVLRYSPIFKREMSNLTEVLLDICIRPLRITITQFMDKQTGAWKRKDFISRQYEKTNGFFYDETRLKISQSFYFQHKDDQSPIVAMVNKDVFPYNSRSGYYIQKIGQLTKKHKIQVYFAFTPNYRSAFPHESYYWVFSSIGDILLPDIKKLYHLPLWRDRFHVYKKGVTIYTDEIIRLIQEGKEASVYYDAYQQKAEESK